MLAKMTKFSLAALTTLAFAGTAAADHHEETLEDADAMVDDVMNDADAMSDGAMADAEAMGEDMEAENMTDQSMTDEEVGRDQGSIMAVPVGSISVGGVVQIGFSKDNIGKPISISPDVWYQATQELRVGVVHSSYGQTNFWVPGNPGSHSLCVSGVENGCTSDTIYPGGSLRGLMDLAPMANVALAVDAGLNWTRAQSAGETSNYLGLRAGLQGAYNSGKLMIGFNPAVTIPLINRDDDGVDEQFAVPVDLGFMATPQLWTGVQTGYVTGFESFTSGSVPLSLAAMFTVDERVGVGAAFGFPKMLGEDSTTDNRSMSIFANYNL